MENLAGRTGLAYSTLALIEENRRTPSLDTLEKIAEAFALPGEQFLSLAARRLVQIRRSQPHNNDSPANPFSDLQSASVTKFNECVILHWIGLTGQKIHTPQNHPNCLDLTCLIRGSIRVEVNGHEYTLTAGETILFDGDLEHTSSILEDAEGFCIHIPRNIQILESLIETRRPSPGVWPC